MIENNSNNGFIYTDMTKKALILAFFKHNGQVDKSGLPYIFHPFMVAQNMPDEITTTIALLHDILEDTETTSTELKELFPLEVVEAVELLTHDNKISYFDYLNNIKNNNNARIVKLSDLKHNSNLSRLNNITDKDIVRQNKYLKAIEFLQND